MTITFTPVIVPKAADGGPLRNGFLGPCDLRSIYMAGHGLLGCHQYTARALLAMQIQFKVATGYDLTVSSAADLYRSADRQRNAFLGRYRKYYNPLTCVLTSRRWGEDGTQWYKLRNVAAVASIGREGVVGFYPSSNHGLGIAADLAIYGVNPKTRIKGVMGITAIPACWQWIQDNAADFGFSWEGAKPGTPGWEPWHVRHVLGDRVSQRVLNIESWIAFHTPKA